MPLLKLIILKIHSFPHFSVTCFDILSWNFAYDFIFFFTTDQVWVSSICVNFCRRYAPYNTVCIVCTVYSNNGTYNTGNTQFSAFFLLHSLTYWAKTLHMTLFNCTTDQVRVSSICINFCRSYAPFGTYITGNTQFTALFSNLLWHIELKFFIWLC